MTYYKFKPYNVARVVIWSLFAILLLVVPLVLPHLLASGSDGGCRQSHSKVHGVFDATFAPV